VTRTPPVAAAIVAETSTDEAEVAFAVWFDVRRAAMR